MGKRYFIYALEDPQNDEIRYVGWIVNPERRLREHIRTAPFEANHKAHWIASLLNVSLRPSMVVIEATENPQNAERFWIKALRADGIHLTNLTDGGEGTTGYRHAPESLAKFASKLRGSVRSDETQASNETRRLLA